ncbi:MAG: tRNA ((37)-N6)-threonylcarbamoyltransferase complex ATPase subunit type 1 TsaE [Hyphomicrobiales bacterium]|nr:tRNA ((37)-N6)-threonylcarbamoyltransferase complex ATPase subunit type 1 TsaE [Hyphomicrobiales bacterium]
MSADENALSTWRLDLPDEAATAALADELASFVAAGDLITLSGDLGAGKTTFARALIRRLCDDPQMETPSPTFTLMQIYDGQRFPIVHADLYRIQSADELAELGWDEAAEGALVLVEWADRIGAGIAPDRLDISLSIDSRRGDGYREATLTGHGAMAERLTRTKGVHALLQASGWESATRTFMLGDASVRAYERLEKPDGSRAILMISPARPDGPAVRYGKSYSAIARLAENVTPFIAMAEALRAKGLSAPQIYAADARTGLIILEDLGADGVIHQGAPMQERYADAASVLAYLHASDTPAVIPAPEGRTYAIPPYDLDALLIEVELLIEWYAPHMADVRLTSGAKAIFLSLWRSALAEIASARQTWVLRDYHSPNLIWLPERSGLARVGLIDFQDCVMGHPAYDVASLLQDARFTVPDDMEMRLLSHYALARRRADPGFDMASFATAYALMGAQRATKVLGIFTRLDRRDHKPAYLAHIPRVEHYLAKSLTHPALAEVRGWYKSHLPRLVSA